MRDTIKNIAANFLFRSGALKAAHSLFYRNKAVILMYHRVVPPSLIKEKSFVQPGMYVTDVTFQTHASLLKKKFKVLPLLELIARLERGDSIAGCCAITFDDGWLDNYQYAFPVLNRFEMPATIFLASSYIGTDQFFWPEQFVLYWNEFQYHQKDIGDVRIKEFLNQIIKVDNNDVFLDQAIGLLKNWDPKKRRRLLEALDKAVGTCHQPRLLMNWKEAGEMHRSGLVDFGAHTANHVILDQIDPTAAKEEIVSSKKEIEANLDCPVLLFSYPNGNYNAELQKTVEKSGFRGGVITKPGWVTHDRDLFSLPRIGFHDDVSRCCMRFYSRLILQRF